MKRFLALFLALLLLAVPAFASGNLVQDDSDLLADHEVESLEAIYSEYPQTHGFTPMLVTVDSFGGLSAEEFAGKYYDVMGCPDDGILLLVSLQEGQWYILTNGECYERISDWDAEQIGEELVPVIQSGSYYGAFLKFPQLAAEVFEANEPTREDDHIAHVEPAAPRKAYGKTIAICMVVGLLIGLIAVGIMASRMKSVRMRSSASDYIRPGSMHLTNSRDIFLYSHVTRTPRPKNTSHGGGGHGGGHGGHHGGSRGGAGGRL